MAIRAMERDILARAKGEMSQQEFMDRAEARAEGTAIGATVVAATIASAPVALTAARAALPVIRAAGDKAITAVRAGGEAAARVAKAGGEAVATGARATLETAKQNIRGLLVAASEAGSDLGISMAVRHGVAGAETAAHMVKVAEIRSATTKAIEAAASAMRETAKYLEKLYPP